MEPGLSSISLQEEGSGINRPSSEREGEKGGGGGMGREEGREGRAVVERERQRHKRQRQREPLERGPEVSEQDLGNTEGGGGVAKTPVQAGQ